MCGQGQQRRVVDDRLALELAQYRGLHAVIEDLPRHPLQVLEGSHVTAQHRLHILVHDKPRPQVAAVAEHQREQPDDTHLIGFILEDDLEVREVDLRLLARGGLEAQLERRRRLRPHCAHEIAQHGKPSAIALGADLAQQPRNAQFRKRSQASTHELLIGLEQPCTRDPRAIDRWFQTPRDVLANGLPIDAGTCGDRRHRQTLLMQFQNHHQSP